MQDVIDVEVYDKFDDLLKMQPAWDNFMEEMDAEIFLSYDWCKLWWQYYGKGRRLKIIIFCLRGKLIGILPVFMENIGIIPFNVRIVKIVGTDFMPTTITLPINPNYLKLIIPIFLDKISFFWSWDILHIGALSGAYKQIDLISETLSNALNGSHQFELIETDVQTYYEIADSFDNQIKTLSPRQRTKTKRVYKELRDKKITLSSIVADEQNYMSFLCDFIDMHQAQWQNIKMPGHFVAWPHARELHKEMASAQIKHDRLRILKIILNDQCIGYEYIYKYGKTYCWFLSARSDLSDYPRIDFHRIAFGEKINHAINDKVRCIDSMRGYYEYKLVLGGKLEPVHSALVCSNKFGSNFKYLVFKKSARLLDIIYMKIWRRRVAPKLNIIPGSLWKLWIKTQVLAVK